MGTVLVHGYDRPIIREKAAKSSESILEGMLLEKASGADTWQKHATAGGNAEGIFAMEDKAGNVDRSVTAYANGANIPGIVKPPIANAWLLDGEVVVEGDALESNGDGTLRKLVAGNVAGLKMAIIAGGAAGNHTVTGIALGDRLVAVIHGTTAAALESIADLTSEFTISATNTINNAAGTDTTNDSLTVFYEDASAASAPGRIVGYADEAKSPSGANVRIKVRVA
jgi:hypothetical protein